VEVLGDDAEFLPLLNPDEEHWFVNSWREIDALDEENSEFKRFPSSGRIMRIIRYAFSEEKVRGAACFKIPQLSEAMFVTDEVVAAVREARLTGTSFQPVWEG
jgi:hypothetical protein